MNALTKFDPDEFPSIPNMGDWWVRMEKRMLDYQQARWEVGDCLAEGVALFGEQACFEFAADKLSIEPKQLRSSAKVASAFPPSMRAADVPFEVHAYIAQLPEERRLETLSKASTEHWGAKEAKRIVTQHRQQTAMFEDEDQETRLAVEIIRAWNRAPAESREYFWELAKVAADGGFAAIDEDEPVHA